MHYATYYDQLDPLELLPDDVDVLFVAAYTQASALAYALATLFRRRGALTVIGGPHARSFPTDCLRFFDLAVGDCDKTLVDDIVRRRFDPPRQVTSGRPLTDFPTVAERASEIAIASFHRGRPMLTSIVPLLSSIGCPYSCNFCVDWNSRYVALAPERLRADLDEISRRWPGATVGYHDPNFAVRFDETMDVMESIPAGRRNPYIMESSLAILRDERLPRLARTNCLYVAPGVESWSDYSNKAGTGSHQGSNKLTRIVAHLSRLAEFVPGIQANFLFGAETDRGSEPAALTRAFIEQTPFVWPTINIPSPFAGTPLYDQWYRDGRILRALPFAFYYNPYLAITLRHYDPPTYYGHLIDMHAALASPRMAWRRMRTRVRPAIRFVHGLRTIAARRELAAFRRIRAMLATDRAFREFHEGRTETLPAYYHQLFEARLGRFAELLPRSARLPVLEAPA